MDAHDAYATANESALYDTIATVTPVEGVEHNIVANKETVLMTHKMKLMNHQGRI